MFSLCMVRQEKVLAHFSNWRLSWRWLSLSLGFCTLLLQTKSTCPCRTLTQVCLELSVSFSLSLSACVCVLRACACVFMLPLPCLLHNFLCSSRSFYPSISFLIKQLMSPAPRLLYNVSPYVLSQKKNRVLYNIYLLQKVRRDECE